MAAELAEAEAKAHLAESQAKQLGSSGSGKKQLEPFYAYSGCKRCLELADEIGEVSFLVLHLLQFAAQSA